MFLPIVLLAAGLGGVYLIVSRAIAPTAKLLGATSAGEIGALPDIWNVPVAQLTRAIMLARLEEVVVSLAIRKPVLATRVREAIRIAALVGLPKTAAGLSNNSGLPVTEYWPGTRTSVVKYFRARVLETKK